MAGKKQAHLAVAMPAIFLMRRLLLSGRCDYFQRPNEGCAHEFAIPIAFVKYCYVNKESVTLGRSLEDILDYPKCTHA